MTKELDKSRIFRRTDVIMRMRITYSRALGKLMVAYNSFEANIDSNILAELLRPLPNNESNLVICQLSTMQKFDLVSAFVKERNYPEDFQKSIFSFIDTAEKLSTIRNEFVHSNFFLVSGSRDPHHVAIQSKTTIKGVKGVKNLEVKLPIGRMMSAVNIILRATGCSLMLGACILAMSKNEPPYKWISLIETEINLIKKELHRMEEVRKIQINRRLLTKRYA